MEIPGQMRFVVTYLLSKRGPRGQSETNRVGTRERGGAWKDEERGL